MTPEFTELLFPIHGKKMEFARTEAPKPVPELEPLWVELTPKEVAYATKVGLERRRVSVKRGYTERHGAGSSGNAAKINIDGALGEQACAKAINVKWTGHIDSFKNPDVGTYHVRTMSRHYYDMLIRKGDDDDGIFILVTGESPRYAVRGWQYAKDCKKKEYEEDKGGRGAPAFFYPQDKLNDIRLLVKNDETKGCTT